MPWATLPAPYDLYTADECFLTGSGAELIPVKAVDGRHMTHCPGEVYSSLLADFKKMVKVQTQY
jgi:branched-chain amino acid aminotransferase